MAAAVAVGLVVLAVLLELIMFLLHLHPLPLVVVQIEVLKIMNLGQITTMDHVFFRFMVAQIQMLLIIIEMQR